MFNTSEPNKSTGIESVKTAHAVNTAPETLSRSVAGYTPLLSGLSREMRTQLNAIVAYSFLMNKKEYNDKDRAEFTEQIHQASEQIINLLDNFFDAAIIEDGNSKSETGILEPGVFFNDLFTEFKTFLGKNRYKDILFVSEIQEFGNEVYVADTTKIARVIRNLFRHAVSNTESGYIKAIIKSINGRFIFSLLDSGSGFLKSRDYLQTNDFAESLSKTGDIYTTVNLNLTLKLIKNLDGMIWIERNGLAGSGIYFSIPAITSIKRDKMSDKFSNSMITI